MARTFAHLRGTTELPLTVKSFPMTDGPLSLKAVPAEAPAGEQAERLDPLAPAHAARLASALVANIDRALKGKRDVIELSLAALAARGHLLLEDVPGVGKTTLAQALARSL